MYAVQRHRLPCGRCLVCGEAADTPAHVLLRCPCLYGPRLRMLDNIIATEGDLRSDDVVAALAAGYTAYKSALQLLPHRPGGDGGDKQQQQQTRRLKTTKGN